MFLNRRPDISLVSRLAITSAMGLVSLLAAAVPVEAQFAPPQLPFCSAPPSPETDTWPVAASDSLGTSAPQPIAFAATLLLANDTGATALTVTSVGPMSSHGGTIAGGNPYTYTPAAGFVGNDAFPYEISDTGGHTAVGIVKITILADNISPTVSISSPTGGVVSGAVNIVATAADNVGVAGIKFFDGATQIGAEVLAPGSSTSWNTLLVANGAHSLTAVARDTAGNTTTSLAVSVTVTNVILTTVPNIVGATAAAAQSAISGATLALGTVTSANSATVALGRVISQSPAAGGSVPVNTTVSYVLSLGPAAVSVPTVQASVSSDGTGPRTTAPFSTTTAGEVLVALVGSDGPTTGTNNQNITVSGAGLTWTRVRRAATQRGDAEIWTATAPSALSNVTVTSTQSVATVLGQPVAQSLHVLAFTGAAGIGGSNMGSGATGAPTVSLVTQSAGSVVYGVGFDFDRSVARTVPATQTKLHEYLAPSGDTMWMQSLNATTGAVGSTATLNDTAPTNDQWNMASVEITSGAPPAAVPVPNVVGMLQAAAQSAITGATLTVGTITTSSSASVPAGQVISQSPVGGGSALAGSPVSLVISSGAAPAAPAAQVTVFKDGSGAQTTPAFSTTTAGEVLVAFATSDGPVTGANNQVLTVSGAGLTWTRIAHASTARGVSDIWTATAAGVLTNVTVTSTQSITVVLGQPVNQSLTVVAFTNASGIGASNIAGATTGAPTISVVAQAANSAVYAVGNDFDHATARTIPAGQVKVHEFLAPSGDTFWVQALSGTTASAGSVTLRATAPTTDQWNFAIVEIKR